MLARAAALCGAAAVAAAQGSVKCHGCFDPLSPKTPKCTGISCFSPTIKVGGCWTIPMGVRSIRVQSCSSSAIQFYEYATKDCSGPVNTTATLKPGACANPAPGQAPAGVWATCSCVSDEKPLPAPAVARPRADGPQPGELYCGKVGGGLILTTNLTIGADGASMDYYNHITIAKTLIACPGEKYEWQAGEGCDATVKGKAGCGTLDVTKTVSDPNDCLAKGGAAEGGAVHTFIYDGPEAGTISAKDSKYGTVEMKLSKNGKC